MQGRVVQHRAHFGFGAALGQNAQLLLRAVVLPGEAEELEKKRPQRDIRRVVAEKGAEGFLRFPDLPGIEKFLGFHVGA